MSSYGSVRLPSGEAEGNALCFLMARPFLSSPEPPITYARFFPAVPPVHAPFPSLSLPHCSLPVLPGPCRGRTRRSSPRHGSGHAARRTGGASVGYGAGDGTSARSGAFRTGSRSPSGRAGGKCGRRHTDGAAASHGMASRPQGLALTDGCPHARKGNRLYPL